MAWPASFLDRLERRLAGLDGPLIQVWSRPGSGARLLLDALQPRVHEIPPAVLTRPDAFAAALTEAEALERPWLLCTGIPAAGDVAPAMAQLTSRQRLVLFTHRRLELDLPPSSGMSWLTPRDWHLTPAEVVEFWRAARGVELSESAALSLAHASDGWLRLLELAADGNFDVSADQARDTERLRALPAVRAFLEVTASLGSDLPDEPGSLSDAGESAGYGSNAWEAVELAVELAVDVQGSGEPDYRVRLFGLPTVERRVAPGRYTEVDFTLRRCFKLLLYLAAAPDHRVGKEELVEVLWSEDEAESVQRNFHPTLSHLRRDLGGTGSSSPGAARNPIVFRNRSYQLNPDLHWEIDVDLFEAQALEAARCLQEANLPGRRDSDLQAAVAAGQRAWKLYRGPFLDGQYDAWTHSRRDDLQRTHLRLLRDLGDMYVRLGRPVDALDAYRAVITEDPMEESVQVAILRLYAAQGRRDLVRRQYDKLCTLLLNELGVEPLPETTAEYHRLMA